MDYVNDQQSQTTVELQCEQRIIAIRKMMSTGRDLSTPETVFLATYKLVSVVISPRKTSGRQGFDADALREVMQKVQTMSTNGVSCNHLKTRCVMFTKRRNWSFSRPLF